MRAYMRDINLGRDPNGAIPASVGMGEEDMYEMFRLLALAKYDERYVIPTAHAEQAHSLEELATGCDVAAYDTAPRGVFGEGSGETTPIAVENFRMLQQRQTADALTPSGQGRVNLLNWDGKGMPEGMFPGEDGEREVRR
jgi:nitrate reductase beta subunit